MRIRQLPRRAIDFEKELSTQLAALPPRRFAPCWPTFCRAWKRADHRPLTAGRRSARRGSGRKAHARRAQGKHGGWRERFSPRCDAVKYPVINDLRIFLKDPPYDVGVRMPHPVRRT